MKKQVKEKQYSPSSSGSSANSAVISSNNVSVFSKLFSHIILILRRLFGFLGLYSYLKVHPSLGWRSSTFSNNYNSNHNGSSSINRAKLRISYIHALRITTYLSTLSIVLLFIATIIPIYTKSNQAEATTGTATASTLTFTSTSSTASVSLNVNSADGTFATSTEEQKVSFSISTNNYTGYTLTIKSGGSVATLNNSGTTISTLSASTDATTFAANTAAGKALNNKWGIIPSYYNSVANTTNYYPAPANSNGITLRATESANSANGINNADTYTIGLGLRADYTNPSGAYSGNALIVEYTANPITYSIAYSPNAGNDAVANMPYNNATIQYTQTGILDHTVTSVMLSGLVPTREGYTFKGWCSAFPTNGTCTGITYNPDGDGTNLVYGIDQTASNVTTVYGMWAENAPISFSIADTSYSAMSGMTWAEWVESAYNTDGYTMQNNGIYTQDASDQVAILGTYSVYAGEEIESGKSYRYLTKCQSLASSEPTPVPTPGSRATCFYNYFYLDGSIYRTVYSGQFAFPSLGPEPEPVTMSPTSLWIVYHDAKIYGLVGAYGSSSETSTEQVLESGTVVMQNVSPDYSGNFFENPDYDGQSGTLPEDTPVRAGYFADFTTYHTSL